MDILLEKTGQIAVFMICAQTLMHFRAKEAYEKYLKLLVSMMLLLLLAEPLMDMLGKGSNVDLLERIEVYQDELQTIVGNRELEQEQITEILSHMTTEAAGQVQLAESVEVEIEYGKITDSSGGEEVK